MIYQYVVTLKNNNRRYIDRISLWLLLISVVAFLSELFNTPGRILFVYLFCCLLITAIVVRNGVIRKRQPGKTVFYNYALFIAAIGWVVSPSLIWLFIPFVLLGLVERQAKFPLEVGFSDESIVINTLFRRRHRWTDFNNIVLKDDLLTLDFKNNRLLQRETIDEEGDADEDEFNDYCRERLTKANSVLG